METMISGLKTSYEVMGTGESLLLLHGWGVESSVFLPMQKHLSQYMRVWTLDFPGFGGTEAPDDVWGVADYARFVQTFCAHMFIENPNLLGHSFGGRVCIVLGSRGFGRRIVLTDAAGIRPPRGAAYYARVYGYKALKLLLRLPGLNKYYDQAMARWYERNSSTDYAQVDGIMRQVFVRVVNEDLKPLLPKINRPTLLMWGENDEATPLTAGQQMEKLIPGSGLVVFKGAGHYPFLEQPARFYRVMESFLGLDNKTGR